MRRGRSLGTVSIGVLSSGSGTNLQAIIDAIEEKRLSARIEVVVSNVPDAYALKRATTHGIRTEVLPHQDFPERESYDKAVVDVLKKHNVILVALAGFMRVLSPVFIRAFPMRIMNIHPALLPSFPGLHAQEKALEYGVKVSGCTVHFVDEGTDTGPIIIQAVVPVHDNDTEDTLRNRILREEHRIYPQAIQLFAEERLKVKGRRVFVAGHHRASQSLTNPPVTIF